jgi:hypothetical protein
LQILSGSYCVLPRFLAVGLLLLIAGCHRSEGLPRVEIRGKVMYEGLPVKHGMIVFRPAAKSKGPAAGAAIADGKFLLTSDKGPTPGPHQVELKIVDASEDSATMKEPDRAFHRAGQLKSFLQQVDVRSGPNEFEFSFPTNPPSSAGSSAK